MKCKICVKKISKKSDYVVLRPDEIRGKNETYTHLKCHDKERDKLLKDYPGLRELEEG